MYDGPRKRWQLGLAVSLVIALGTYGFGDALQSVNDETATITISSGVLGER